MHRRSRNAARLVAGLLLASAAGDALAGIDAVLIEHRSGPCSDFRFPPSATDWGALGSGGASIPIAIGETVVVTLYGPGVNQATDATGPEIFEWIDARGTNARGKDYVRLAVRAEAQHGTGNRVVTIQWPSVTGSTVETIRFAVVGSCEKLRGLGMRIAPVPQP